jgi:hypothetical protein
MATANPMPTLLAVLGMQWGITRTQNHVFAEFDTQFLLQLPFDINLGQHAETFGPKRFLHTFNRLRYRQIQRAAKAIAWLFIAFSSHMADSPTSLLFEFSVASLECNLYTGDS